jgi:hypothetical protein
LKEFLLLNNMTRTRIKETGKRKEKRGKRERASDYLTI